MKTAVDAKYALVPIALHIENGATEQGGSYDVSSLTPAREWREGCELNSEESDAAPRDDQFISDALDAIRECADRIARHFASIGSVIAPKPRDYVGDDKSPDIGMIVAAGDVELASKIAHIWATFPPIGRFRNLAFESDPTWANSACAQTIEDLFGAACRARDESDFFGQPTPFASDRLPRVDESMDDWTARVCVSSDRLNQTLEAWEASCRDVNLFSMHPLAVGARDGDIIDWLIPGLIQRGEVTSLVGPGGVGKTTALAELVAKVSDSPLHGTEFLGTKIEHSNGLCAYISAEDRQGVMKLRIEQYQAAGSALNAFLIDGCGRAIEECLALLDALPSLDLVIVDPVTQFVDDENEAGKVGPFYNALSAFARRKNCAIIAVHHLTKSKGAGRTSNVRSAIRGSSVHVDRPRLVFCMLPRGDGLVEVGIVKSNVPPGQPTWCETGKGRLFRQMPEGLAGIETETPLPASAVEGALHDWVANQISVFNESGRPVRRTGRKGLYNLTRGPELEFSRAAIESGVSDLIARGRLVDDVDMGLMSARGEAH
ncbi:hypothetical protein ASD67_00140 [Sphingopyxis sp. Root1497]|uniref:AAA family ATPase n=1 Tax=Sphingopyxis sp. Root1497 TaxID=1736474 RepID=UPI0006FEC664|nr:AAA family ATPase [Sphingopyxis sp. Root1497]KQZ65565.1 hypothetical protein ASD67_00140 [Sphingopyxis sp. Root1497]